MPAVGWAGALRHPGRSGVEDGWVIALVVALVAVAAATFTASIGTVTEDVPLEGAGFGFIGAKTSDQPC